jgi:Asp-tRNA(Asn)/Glu-tRNA(Gln) amidotransferase A subunit family amidase
MLALAPAAHGASEKHAHGPDKFHLVEATIDDIHEALQDHEITCVDLVGLYLKRIKAYNGTCVSQPNGLLGPITTIANAGQLNSLQTINLRPANRVLWGFDQRHARSQTDLLDNDPNMPDALETAAALDAQLSTTHKMGALFCVPMAIKDEYDTFDMRSTSGADAFYANDRPPNDADAVAKLRQAGAVILAKANMGEYASGDRSSFGGTMCNPYDTQRSAGRSSSGSGSSTSANLVTCAIGEETGPSIRNPASNDSDVGLAGTEELVSRVGLIPATVFNDRVGPLCRTVRDAARIFDVIAGYDPKDPLTAFNVNQLPKYPYWQYTLADSDAVRSLTSLQGSAVGTDEKLPLKGIRIGVIREYMVPWTNADVQSIAIVENAIGVLKSLGADVVDPGPGGELFRDTIVKLVPYVEPDLLPQLYPALFAGIDQVDMVVNLFFDTGLFPSDVDAPNIRNLGPENTTGQQKYTLNRYLRERGDPNIQSITDLINKSNFWNDPFVYSPPQPRLVSANADTVLSIKDYLNRRFSLQQIVRQELADNQIDVLVYPTKTIPAPILTNPTEPTVHGRGATGFTVLGAHGIPALSVPAGYTTEVYDRVRQSPSDTVGVLTSAVPAQLPVNIDFMGAPFSEPMLLYVASMYEAASHSRMSPPAFPSLPGEP